MHPAEKSRSITEICESVESYILLQHGDGLSDLRHFSSLAGMILYLAGTYLIVDVLTSQNAFMGALPMT